jgi:hypothetical protein
MKKSLFLSVCTYLLVSSSFSQTNNKLASQIVERKVYNNLSVGDVVLTEKRTEIWKGKLATTFAIEVKSTSNYFIQIISPFQKSSKTIVNLDGVPVAEIVANEDGWQATKIITANKNGITLTAGKHEIRFISTTNQFPPIDQISITKNGIDEKFDNDLQRLKQNITTLSTKQLETKKAIIPSQANSSTTTEKVLANPLGAYGHNIDEAFTFTTFQYYYFTAGTTVTFQTVGSTTDPVLHLFNSADLNQSWVNDDYNGIESKITITIPTTGSYFLVARSFYGTTGTTNIIKDGIIVTSTTPIGGKLYFNDINASSGDKNYFTCKLTGYSPDTRLFTIPTTSGAFNAYNDDCNTGGDFVWGLSSRIKKNYTTTNNYSFICSYSTASTGSCDLYMSADNSNVYNSFVNLKAIDAIQAAPVITDYYNCISWSGGITTAWSWPIGVFDIYYIAGNPLGSFDNFYKNTPVKRYSGAWNYTRTGATVSNSVVDLWAYNGSFTHGSVRKPGNNHPHGYDWESKPGSLSRTFHPRNALNGGAPANYGEVVNYYFPTGTFAKSTTNKNYTTDKDAIDAGLDVADKISLTIQAMEKLNTLQQKVISSTKNKYQTLFEDWKKTWEENKVQSNIQRYCENESYKALLSFCKKNQQDILPEVMRSYLENNIFCSAILFTLTEKKYGNLLEEVKQEFIKNPYTENGKFIVNNPYYNGVRYIEKILREQKEISLTNEANFDLYTVAITPNPIKDNFSVLLNLKEDAIVSIQMTTSKNNYYKKINKESNLKKGNYNFAKDITTLNLPNGSLINVTVRVNTIVTSYKILVMK